MIERAIHKARVVAGAQLRRSSDAVRRRRAAARLAALPDGARVHLGCGPNKFAGWVNVDIDRWSRPDVRHDLRLGLPARPKSLSRIYSEHVFEHLHLKDGERLLADCASVLCDGGILRIAMPDLSLLVDRYRGDWRAQAWLDEPAYRHITTAAEMLNVALREWGHRYVYDFEDLNRRLRTAGFRVVERPGWGESSSVDLRGLETRPDSRLIVEARVA